MKAAVATGVVDPKRIGLQGHSWGGYQTSFLVTQTNVFAAAVAGAPLTNMISMYSLIYKNTGGGNRRSSRAARAGSTAATGTTGKPTSATRRCLRRRT